MSSILPGPACRDSSFLSFGGFLRSYINGAGWQIATLLHLYNVIASYRPIVSLHVPGVLLSVLM